MKQSINRNEAKNCIGKGWHGLIDEVYDEMKKFPPKSIDVVQVKEKFGNLRIYVSMLENDSNTEEGVLFYDFLEDICERSGFICENCGKPGKHEDVNGWVKTFCELCFNFETITKS